tara:strand:- start:715 stop:1110 length:396 start_codon:yes stop_codon:yes gene_type:complete
MSRWQITLWSPEARKRACEWISKAPDGYRVTLQETKRTVPQNDRMWAMLAQVSTQLVWHGQRYSPEQWKDFFCHQLSGGAFMPAEDGGMIPIGRSTSKLGKQEHSLLTEIIEGFAERQGVDLMQQNERSAA